MSKYRLEIEVKGLAPVKEAKVEIPVPGATIFIGRNATGKSRVVQAIYFLHELLKHVKSNEEEEIEETKVLEEMKENFTWAVKEFEIDWSDLLIGKEAYLSLKEYKGRKEPSAFIEVEIKEESVRARGRREKYQKRIPITVIGPYRPTILFLSSNFRVPKAYKSFMDVLSSYLLERKKDEIKENAKCIENVKVVFNKYGFVYLIENDRRLSPEGSASGWLSVALIELVGELERKKGIYRILAIEEPEVHLNPSLLKCEVENLLLTDNLGVIITTHSPLVIEVVSNLIVQEKVDPSDVKAYEFRLEREGSTTRELKVDEYGIENPLLKELEEVSASILRKMLMVKE